MKVCAVVPDLLMYISSLRSLDLNINANHMDFDVSLLQFKYPVTRKSYK